ncbi:hypothetical protein F4778DRAFT_394526 [Xylariomycetidae sp. FL2044]|nr:hypothetical protein F4778DRAFT_394526 [Xylariomycetidae sp. FL2044]
MKKSMILATAAAVLSLAQDFGGQPSCAIPCLTSAISAAGCQLTDVACQCNQGKAAIADRAATCIPGKCNVSELLQASSAGEAVCSSFAAGELTSSSVPATTTTTTTAATGMNTSSGSSSVTSAPPTTSAAAVTSGMNITSGATKTNTLDGLSPTLDSSLTDSLSIETPTISSPNVAATPAVIGAGVLAGVFGVVAVL